MIAVGCDHGGYELKREIIRYFENNNIQYLDLGTHTKESTDYPIYAKLVCNSILSGECDKGILICGTGIGISIAANRYRGIRAALCGDCFSAQATREHNDANVLDELSARTGRVIIGNKSASGTEILDELAEEEIATGHMIVYTSADSVLQICGNEETFGLEELYRCCEIAREITMKDEWKVGRIIARPYVGKKKGEFKRTANRHDYALKPYGPTALNALKDAGYDVISVGKIFDIFDGEGLTESNKSKSSVHGMEQTIEIAKRDFTGLCYVNLVDFDALWGHRRDVEGYAQEIEKFDVKLGELLGELKADDLLIITADHGNDPTHTGTDHTRERVPFIAYSPSMEGNGKLDNTETFAVIGATIAENFGVEMPEGTIGSSLYEKLI